MGKSVTELVIAETCRPIRQGVSDARPVMGALSDPESAKNQPTIQEKQNFNPNTDNVCDTGTVSQVADALKLHDMLSERDNSVYWRRHRRIEW